MYIDTKETAFVQDLSRPTLRNLSYILRHRELWPVDFQWNFTFCQSCAIGLAYQLWRARPHDAFPEPLRAEIFCSPRGKRMPFLFLFERTPSMHQVTPGMVADHIDKYLGCAE